MASAADTSVFIVDDNELTRAVLRLMLSGAGYPVVGEAGTGAAALARIKALRPAIVCLDIELPDSDGLDLLSAILAAHPKTHVLMISASNERATVHEAIVRGAAGFVIKPFNSGTVLDTLAKTAALVGA